MARFSSSSFLTGLAALSRRFLSPTCTCLVSLGRNDSGYALAVGVAYAMSPVPRADHMSPFLPPYCQVFSCVNWKFFDLGFKSDTSRFLGEFRAPEPSAAAATGFLFFLCPNPSTDIADQIATRTHRQEEPAPPFFCLCPRLPEFRRLADHSALVGCTATATSLHSAAVVRSIAGQPNPRSLLSHLGLVPYC
ncbi:hypothetical protein ZIOFF_062164 [Zingiber officinale]|uniref:Secreted protein n=1 Tax=Zingiber officinale TaxID=94328 RepID=A0A8J5K975_ZINOF|nr:hypothetical protein ZIOFF_062164 [Zingiber officinale]